MNSRLPSWLHDEGPGRLTEGWSDGMSACCTWVHLTVRAVSGWLDYALKYSAISSYQSTATLVYTLKINKKINENRTENNPMCMISQVLSHDPWRQFRGTRSLL